MNAGEIRNSIMKLSNNVREKINENEQPLPKVGPMYRHEIPGQDARKLASILSPLVSANLMQGREDSYENMGATNEEKNGKNQELDRVSK